MINRVLFSLSIVLLFLTSLFSCQNSLPIETMQYASNGQKLYVKHCQNCHGVQGEGLGKLYPPLTDSLFLNEHRSQLACIIRNGMRGEIKVHGVSYNQQMPAIPELTNIDIAYVLTYITTYFGNSKTHFKQEEIAEFLGNCKK
jgi:mono/diheme cytochrome c family protein